LFQIVKVTNCLAFVFSGHSSQQRPLESSIETFIPVGTMPVMTVIAEKRFTLLEITLINSTWQVRENSPCCRHV